MVTPFTDDNQVDHDTLARLIDWQIAEGSHAISVTGTTGEPSSLSLAERRAVMETAIRTAAGRVPVVPATGSTNIDETVYLTKEAEKLGADAVLVIVPYYNRPSQQGLFQYFTTVARTVNLPVVVYNIPGRTATNIEPQTLKRIRQHADNVIGIKESNRDFEQVTRVLSLLGRDFLVYSGIESLCFPMLAVGGAGHISATANLLPKAVADLYNLTAKGRWEEARELHYRLFPLNDVLFIETNPGPLKAAMAMTGQIRPHLRLPLVVPSDEHQAKIHEVLQSYGLLQPGRLG
ncbi:4-hydroxy-tetrahydrodipicolinate synthase [Sulfobacillus sp. DSM 109850]|uniref:4-hydroxy-tetrahydrodipicolinate synthase n=2 Tax=Sulfobacillus harzensis TaxID=2729629 RepID=A0A7Y0L173_9FIRM|nr:4-hydroxy-tetrahydrodipicolinate synthase [Sulfobacillus harzensis]